MKKLLVVLGLLVGLCGVSFADDTPDAGTCATPDAAAPIACVCTPAPSTGVGRAFTPADASTLALWQFDEGLGAGQFANAVAGGPALAATGAVYSGGPGLFGNGARTENNGRVASPAAVAEPVDAITVSVWVKLNSYPSSSANVQGVWKAAGAGWAAPYRVATPFTVSNGYVGALLQTASNTDNWMPWFSIQAVPLNTWVHFALTYDGAFVRWYYNGQLAGTRAQTGAIAYGSHGAWGVGAPAGDSYDLMGDLFVDNLRVDSVARSPSFVLAEYKAGVGSP